MSIISILIILGLLFIIEIFYFKIADHFNIIDRPNHRSSHQISTIRGGGIIFLISAILFFFYNKFEYPYFIVGLFIISLISFLDDIFTLNNRLRISIHVFSVVLMLCQLVLYELPWYWVIIGAVFIIGAINAYNFMDGINGITGAYSLITIGTFYYVNRFITPFTSDTFLIIIGLALVVFNFFNFRFKAKCFAGDVGSVSIAYIVLFSLLQLIIKTENCNYLLFLVVYGLDAITTIFFRILRKENIFEAHRSHFYQYWANERKVPHLLISSAYALLQLVINVIVILWIPNSLFIQVITLLSIAIIFIIIRFSTEGSDKLLGTKIA